jgi:hypothetical protein
LPPIECCTSEAADIVVTIQNAKAFPRLTVLLENRGKNPANIWDDSNSWGWENLSFCAILTDGKAIQIQRKEVDRAKNVLRYVTLKAGERITREVRLDDEWWTINDEELQQAKYVCGIYSIRPTTQSNVHKIWTGLAVGQWHALGRP